MGGQKISAQDALAFGLVDRLSEPDDLLTQAHALTVDTIAATPEIAIGIKRMCGASDIDT